MQAVANAFRNQEKKLLMPKSELAARSRASIFRAPPFPFFSPPHTPYALCPAPTHAHPLGPADLLSDGEARRIVLPFNNVTSHQAARALLLSAASTSMDQSDLAVLKDLYDVLIRPVACLPNDVREYTHSRQHKKTCRMYVRGFSHQNGRRIVFSISMFSFHHRGLPFRITHEFGAVGCLSQNILFFVVLRSLRP